MKFIFALAFFVLSSAAHAAVPANTVGTGFFFADIMSYRNVPDFTGPTTNFTTIKGMTFYGAVPVSPLTLQSTAKDVKAATGTTYASTFASIVHLSKTAKAMVPVGDPLASWAYVGTSRWPVPSMDYANPKNFYWPVRCSSDAIQLITCIGLGNTLLATNSAVTEFYDYAAYNHNPGADCPAAFDMATNSFAAKDCKGRSRVYYSIGTTDKKALYIGTPNLPGCNTGYVSEYKTCKATADTLFNHKKDPTKIPCEILWRDDLNKFEHDYRNPNCRTLLPQLLLTDSSAAFQYAGQKVSITKMGVLSDGSASFNFCFADLTTRCFYTSAYSNSGYQVSDYTSTSTTYTQCGTTGQAACPVVVGTLPGDPAPPVTPNDPPIVIREIGEKHCGTSLTPACPGLIESMTQGLMDVLFKINSSFEDGWAWLKDLVGFEELIIDPLDAARGAADQLVSAIPADNSVLEATGRLQQVLPVSMGRCEQAILPSFTFAFLTYHYTVPLNLVEMCNTISPYINFSAWIATLFILFVSINHIFGGSAALANLTFDGGVDPVMQRRASVKKKGK